jgi:hypothetical protein
MRRLFAATLVAGSVALTPATSSSAARSEQVVPLRVQKSIRAAVKPFLAYVPVSVPRDYRYLRWLRSRSAPLGLSIEFAWRTDRDPQLIFNVQDARRCPEIGRPMAVFRFGTIKVNWSTTYEDSQAWRCVSRSNRKTFFIVSAPGNGSEKGPSGRALARMIGTAQLIR